VGLKIQLGTASGPMLGNDTCGLGERWSRLWWGKGGSICNGEVLEICRGRNRRISHSDAYCVGGRAGLFVMGVFGNLLRTEQTDFSHRWFCVWGEGRVYP
jgi:hypothetical protein